MRVTGVTVTWTALARYVRYECVCISTHVYVCKHVCVYVCAFVCVYVCVCVCVFVSHKDTHTHTHTQYAYANGDHYVGRFSRNMREGKGCMFLAASSIKLDCHWERDRPAIFPARLTVESSDHLLWVPPTPPPSKGATDEEGAEEAPAGEDSADQPSPRRPPPLKEILAAPLAPGGCLPRFHVTVEGIYGGGLSGISGGNGAAVRAMTPGGGLAGTQPQLGESGRLLHLTFGQFERDENVVRRTPTPGLEGEEPREKPAQPYKTFPKAAYAIRVLPPERAQGTTSPTPQDDGEAAAPPATQALPPGAATGEGGEGMEDGEAALKRMLDQSPPWPFQKVYPPPNCVGGFKVINGRVSIPRYSFFLFFSLFFISEK